VAEAQSRASFADSDRPVKVSVVLPCLDEASSVGRCVLEAIATLDATGMSGEVVVVDNGSTDGSPEIAERAGARVVHETERGYGSALLAGFRAARGDVVVMADADYTYDLTSIPDLVAPILRDDADLVVGSRLKAASNTTMPWLHRYVGTPALTFLTARACGGRVVHDSQSGFRAFRRGLDDRLELHSTGMELASEMLIRAARAGLRIQEIDTGYRARIGESKLATFGDGWRHLRLISLLAPDLLLLGPGLALLGFGILLQIMSFVRPSGIEIGSLQWQPVFFSSIAIVLGVQAVLAGAVLAHHSSLAAPGVRRRLQFMSHERFLNACFAVGVALVAAGLAINFVLFILWVDDSSISPLRSLSSASLAQSLIIVGGTLASFAVISRFQRAREFRQRVARVRALGRDAGVQRSTAVNQ
jgi:glycosyltransferase involved in cell wall biosynthesis